MNYNDFDKEKLIEMIKSKDNEIQKLNEEREKLKYYALTDVMTGLLNRRAGLELLNNEFQLTKELKGNLVVCFIDVDNLKIINDTFGHNEGDKLLISATEIIKCNIRKHDFVIRMGGDEFLVVFPRTTILEADKIWNNICVNIDKINYKNNKYDINLSYGFYEYGVKCKNDVNISELIMKANKQMYYNKVKK
ncbi:GGDEF domain-containing protein [Clostridium butyricum]|uniref:GGDEF domain-containing protein n=1 Tax=Clostridium butyricum TaxID=1492 RepID=UPI0011DE0C60|nr:GGDEF domain-containing protein [Clostridium butyricum]